ncbi:MAG TPA: hypothetical protein ENJ00_11805 [Phycisphaerales bacterium]|nr:hypothetical protein [Phycisphaerales bacterium]
MWSFDQIADLFADSIVRENNLRRAENAVLGIDALDETQIQPTLADAVIHAGLGVIREHPFPTPTRKHPKESERLRCDLVILEHPDQLLIDPVETDRRRNELLGTLFEPVAEQAATTPGIRPEHALWIELKVCGQYEYHAGVPVPNPSYTAQLVTGPAKDIRKLSKEPAIDNAAAGIILFAESEDIARHDLALAVHKWLDRDLPIRSPTIRIVPIDERIGNTVAAVCLTPIKPKLNAIHPTDAGE